MRRVFLVGVFTLGAILSGCALVPAAIHGALSAADAADAQAKKDAKKGAQLTQLQTRQLQTRTYDTNNVREIIQVALAVLQDDGFNVGNADVNVGLLTGRKSLHETNVDDGGTAFLKGFFGVGGAVSQEFSTIEVTVTVRSYGKEKTRVRVSARLSSVGTGAAGINYEAVTDPEFYKDFFTKMQKGLFIEQEEL